jgi:hypothetical protein
MTPEPQRRFSAVVWALLTFLVGVVSWVGALVLGTLGA